MHLSRFEIRDFRNLGRQELQVPEAGVAIIGGNAQGKSNLLEAIYYLETFRSFRGARDDQLVAFEAEAFRLVARLGADAAAGRAVEVSAAFQKRGRRKKVTVDGAEAGRLGDALGRLAAVVFSPADVGLVNEGPSARRRFLDVLLSLNEPGYLEALQRYRSVLGQRNAALKAAQAPPAVRIWDRPLAEAGAEVARARRAWIDRWGPRFSGYCAAISGGTGASMTYRPGARAETAGTDGAAAGSEDAEAFLAALCASWDRDRRHGNTGVGPHRDEVRVRLDREDGDLDVRDYGSGGQRRTVALALRLTEAATVREARGQEPIVLLDDVFAELDEGRGARILELIEREETGQVILTAPKEGDVRVRRDTLPRWTIEEGEIRA